jgi:transcriptional regulator with XRE-family HTH domain
MLRLRQLRNAKNMSREELGKVVGLSKSMIAAFEQDKRKPRWETIQKLCDFFKVSTEYLMEIEENPTHVIFEVELLKGSSSVENYLLERKPNLLSKQNLEFIIKERLMKLGINNLSKSLTIIRLYISGPVMIILVTLEILLSYGFSVEIIEFDNIRKEFINQGMFKR